MVAEVYSREESKYLKVGMYVALGILIVAAFYVANKDSMSHNDSASYYYVDARFNRTDGLLVGDKVRMAGMDVGRVVGAKLDNNFKAILTLDVLDGIKIPDDSSASIVSSSIMGPKYIEIEPGGSEEYLSKGGEFAYTQDAMVLEELLDRIVGIGKANRKNNCAECVAQNKE